MSNYEPLFSYLSKQTASEVTLSFAEIESILGFALPPSAYSHSAWWSNSKTSAHPYSQSWQAAGYKTKGYSSSIFKQEMTFIKP